MVLTMASSFCFGMHVEALPDEVIITKGELADISFLSSFLTGAIVSGDLSEIDILSARELRKVSIMYEREILQTLDKNDRVPFLRYVRLTEREDFLSSFHELLIALIVKARPGEWKEIMDTYEYFKGSEGSLERDIEALKRKDE